MFLKSHPFFESSFVDKSHSRPIVWMDLWSRDSHNNHRYSALFARFQLVDRHYLLFSSNGRLGRLRRISRELFCRANRRFRLARRLRNLSKRYRVLFCSSVWQIQYFPGPVIVDDDDPKFTVEHMLLLAHPNVMAVVTTSDLLRDKLVAHGLTAPCHIIPSGVDFSRLDPRKAFLVGQALGKDPDEIVVGYATPFMDVGSPVHRKHSGLHDLTFLVRAMGRVWEKMPSVKLWLLGHPTERLKAYALRHPQVRLLGFIPPQEILSYELNFDIAVYPRLIDHGGRHRIKLLEFMACRCPIVSTTVSESFLVTRSGCGILAQDESGFAEAILKLAQDRELRRSLGERGFEFAKGYDWDELARRYEHEIFEPYLRSL